MPSSWARTNRQRSQTAGFDREPIEPRRSQTAGRAGCNPETDRWSADSARLRSQPSTEARSVASRSADSVAAAAVCQDVEQSRPVRPRSRRARAHAGRRRFPSPSACADSRDSRRRIRAPRVALASVRAQTQVGATLASPCGDDAYAPRQFEMVGDVLGRRSPRREKDKP